MSTTDQHIVKQYPETWKKRPFITNPVLRWLMWLAVAVYVAVALGTLEVNWERVAEGIPRGHKFLLSFFVHLSLKTKTHVKFKSNSNR